MLIDFILVLSMIGAPAGHDMRMYWVQREGVAVRVSGYKNERGNIVWDMNDESNRLAFESAKSEKNFAGKGYPNSCLSNGVCSGQIRSGSHYTANGEEATLYVQNIVDPSEAESSQKFHVTIVGTDEQRRQVVNDIKNHPAFSDIRANLWVQDYAPNEWPVSPSLGFKTDGKPSILVQAARNRRDPVGGRVVLRTSDYSMGPEKLAEAIRRASPHYNPDLDPGIRNELGSYSWLIVGGVLAGAMVLLPKKT